MNSTEVKLTVVQFCSVIAKRLRAPWISPEERQEIEAQECIEAQKRAEEEERQRNAELKRRAEEERVRIEAQQAQQKERKEEERSRQEQLLKAFQEDDALERAKQEERQRIAETKKQAEVRREAEGAEQRRREREKLQQSNDESLKTEDERRLGREQRINSRRWPFPWYSVLTLREARRLSLIAVRCFGAMAVIGAAVAINGFFSQWTNANNAWIGAAFFGGTALFFAGCAVGIYFDFRVAALLGFISILLLLCFALYLPFAPPWLVGEVRPKLAELTVIIIFLVLSGLTFNGVIGTFATSRLKRGEEEKENSATQ